MSTAATLLHFVSAIVMLWGHVQLDTLVPETWINEQRGGHWQQLTVQGLAAAFLTMLFGLFGDLFPSIKGFRKAQRTLLMVSLPVCAVVALIYWTLLFLFPALILPPVPGWNSEFSSSSAAPPLYRVPLLIDLALHASPVIALVTEFVVFQAPYSSYDMNYIAPALGALAGVWYGAWVEYCATYNGNFPYPFLTNNPFETRLGIYAGAIILALTMFRVLNVLHPNEKQWSHYNCMSQNLDDTFELYDLRVEVTVPKEDGRRILCGAKEGDYFELKGEMITLPNGKGFSMYSLAAVLPLLAAKQRCREKKDWMWTDDYVACPDPNCPTKLKIIRTGIRTFRHGEVTVVPLESSVRSLHDGHPII